ncbi:type II toxin-antitoxin system VapC family toxin [Neorhizobium sp. T786]|uniref:type II toxin-antitoxin system VapC family toxin n=1 Tax=Pseudorhizobium xiangyangii TaxID=2883104 RepID=UPI001CFF9520|nr:type II toxin-antitoxin system VapC family toxin [Neorhizobium xiangyangii]MCB5203176.1 type II toxin-antitoxin system VapC family toxin [Neorhizobium xiangyangii]
MFDTNVWIFIDGYDPRQKAYTSCYSDFYLSLLKSDNTIVVNDYVLGEYFNRACRIQYDLKYEDDPPKRHFKRRRQGEDFKEFMETVRDTCLGILDHCEYEPAVRTDCLMAEFITEAGSGTIDFSDIIIREHCLANDYVLVSDDADFADCGLDFVTANPKVLGKTT